MTFEGKNTPKHLYTHQYQYQQQQSCDVQQRKHEEKREHAQHRSAKISGVYSKLDEKEIVGEVHKLNQPMKNFCLKGNQITGSILIGHYNYVTQLEVSENEMEVLDLLSLVQLEILRCNHNKLVKLMVNGSNLKTLMADCNCLHHITVFPLPAKLELVNISHNFFSALPKWISDCHQLVDLNASHNQLHNCNDFLERNQSRNLQFLNLSYNCIHSMEKLPDSFANLKALYLQSNALVTIPNNLFNTNFAALKKLNIACNKLKMLPITIPHISSKSNVVAGGTSKFTISSGEQVIPKDSVSGPHRKSMSLEVLIISGNQLDDRIFEILQPYTKLRIFYAAYNKITQLPSRFVKFNCNDLEELMLSGNMLQKLPLELCQMSKLQVLKLHSNLLFSMPSLSRLTNLRILDLARNHLDQINLSHVITKNLRYLDLSFNQQLQVNEEQMKIFQRIPRKWNLIDVTGRRRTKLPTSISDSKELEVLSIARKTPWVFGFSETSGKCRKMLVYQLRESKWKGQEDEAFYGMFATEMLDKSFAIQMSEVVPQLLQQHIIKNEVSQCLKLIFLAMQNKFKSSPFTGGVLCYISKENIHSKICVRSKKTKRYMLRAVGSGNIQVYLVRKTSNMQLIGHLLTKYTPSHAISDKEPVLVEWILDNDDDYLVIGNAGIWSVMDINRLAREIRKEENVVMAAKRAQDIAENLGATGNLSLMLVKFRSVCADVEGLIKELKQTVGNNAINFGNDNNMNAHSLRSPNICKIFCSDGCIIQNEDSSKICCRSINMATAERSGRSSPSGQGDKAISMVTPILDTRDNVYTLANASIIEEQSSDLEILKETDSTLSEEQFKCWEYMLEQNTQLLFDKELNTISQSFDKNKKHLKLPERFDSTTNLFKSYNLKFISNSSPHLSNNSSVNTIKTDHGIYPSQFIGNNHSFFTSRGVFSDLKSKDCQNCSRKLCGGPNAAYFSSLQRLIPCNLEYDFSLMQEMSSLNELEESDKGNNVKVNDDIFHEQSHRMHKYWGVATTEL